MTSEKAEREKKRHGERGCYGREEWRVEADSTSARYTAAVTVSQQSEGAAGRGERDSHCYLLQEQIALSAPGSSGPRTREEHE